MKMAISAGWEQNNSSSSLLSCSKFPIAMYRENIDLRDRRSPLASYSQTSPLQRSTAAKKSLTSLMLESFTILPSLLG